MPLRENGSPLVHAKFFECCGLGDEVPQAKTVSHKGLREDFAWCAGEGVTRNQRSAVGQPYRLSQRLWYG